MENSLFHQKMKDLKEKLSSINEDIVEIQKNNKKKHVSLQKDRSPMKIQNIKINKKLFENKNRTINNVKKLEYFANNEVLFNLTSPSETPQKTPNKKIFFNKHFYEHLENNKIKKRLDKELTEDSSQNNIFEKNNKINNRYNNSNKNLDGEMSFRQKKDENVKVNNKLSNLLNSSRNPISLRSNKRYNPYSINTLYQDNTNENNKRKDLNSYNILNNNNTICISYDNDAIQREKRIRKKMPSNHNLYSLISPKNKNLLNSKTVYFEAKSNKKRNDINNINNINSINNVSNDYDLVKNETISKNINNNNMRRIIDIKKTQFFSGKLLKVKIKNNENNKIDNNENQIINKKKINYNNFQNKKQGNSISFNKLLVNGNTLINDRSNKLIRIQNKIFNISDNLKTNINNFDKEKLIVKINKQLMRKQKKNSLFKNSNSLTENNLKLDSKREKKENEISPNLINKFNQNIADSKITNNFILKLIKLYYESTGLTIIKENDLDSTLTILYSWIENISKKFYGENKKLNEEMQYKALRNKIMNEYQLKNKNELKTFLIKILGSD